MKPSIVSYDVSRQQKKPGTSYQCWN